MLGNMNHPLEMNLSLLTSHFECLKLDELVLVCFLWLRVEISLDVASVYIGILTVTGLDLCRQCLCWLYALFLFRKMWELVGVVLLPEKEK